ncbi:MAG: exodeoxyribonuclease VII large subunit [Bacillales bacterium]|nr:exodeoxyribonuclease VII large subunit [Bacillales bacterium]
MNDKYLTVTAVTKYIKYKIDTDDNLKCIFIKGEISNCKYHSTGHIYFSIKDENSILNAIMFSTNAKKLTFTPNDGMKVLITGRISVYEAAGRYQIYVEEMIEDGVGNLYAEFEKLKKKLETKGLFDSNHKKDIPKMPSKVGVITASTGAAIRDIVSTIKRRFPICEIYLFPSLVQGENSSKDLVNKLLQADNYGVDVIIIGRGGGSIEDLWAFNDEELANTIYNAKTPIISAVGHEVDFTICDFVSDLRAPTPTGAAELAVPNMSDIMINLEHLKIRLNESLNKKIDYNKLLLNNLKNSFVLKNPMLLYENKKQNIDLYFEKLNNMMNYRLERTNTKFSNLINKLELLNPLSVLSKGYSVTYKDDKVIKDASKLKKNDSVTIRLYNGLFEAKVEEIKK